MHRRLNPGGDLSPNVQHGRVGALMNLRRKRNPRRGVTLLELAISITVMGILLSLVVPSFARVREQNQVDAATQFLRSIWCAERVYWLENRTFTDSLSTLKDMGLI